MFGKLPTRSRRGARRCPHRRGAATVELAITLPFLFTLVFGVIEVGRALEVSQVLQIAVREGARFGATDRQGYIPDGKTANQKIVEDIRNYLIASGLPGGSADIECLSIPDDEGTPQGTFDFDDPNNHLKSFEVVINMPYSAVTYCPPKMQKFFLPTHNLTATAVFRNYHK
jgi:Flp pilus assembly protein TadG